MEVALGLLWLLAAAGGVGGGSGSPGGVAAGVSDEELRRVSEELYEAERHQVGTGDIVLRLQHRIDAQQAAQGIDYASQRLFSFVAEAELFPRATFRSLLALLDNYEAATGHNETVTPQEEEEQEAFLQAVFQTPVMATLTKFFLDKGLYGSERSFRADLRQMWFGLYSRSGGRAQDSSGFEHVFHGELKKGQVSGGHSWVQLYLLERSGDLNYLSYNYDGPWESFPDVLALQYRWGGHLKPIGSTLMGSSPEFDLALYTLCYKTRPDRLCHLSLGGKAATIQTYSWTNSFYGDRQRFLATSYPVSP